MFITKEEKRKLLERIEILEGQTKDLRENLTRMAEDNELLKKHFGVEVWHNPGEAPHKEVITKKEADKRRKRNYKCFLKL